MMAIAGDEGTENWRVTLPDESEREIYADRVLIEVEASADLALMFVRLENVTVALLPYGSAAERL